MATATQSAPTVTQPNIWEPDLPVGEDYDGIVRDAYVVSSQTGKLGLRVKFRLYEHGEYLQKTYSITRYPSPIEETETYRRARAGAARDEELLELDEFALVQDEKMLKQAATSIRKKRNQLEVPLRVVLDDKGVKNLEFAREIVFLPEQSATMITEVTADNEIVL